MRNRLKIEKIVFEEIKKADGNAILYSDLVYIVNNCLQKEIGSRTLSWAMKKHLETGLIIPKRMKIDGRKTLIWKLPDSTNWETFQIVRKQD